jgi:glycine betaine/proline transport system substrate-binding protein
MRTACSLLAPLLAVVLGSNALAADVVVGVPNWPSVTVTANIIKLILERNYGVSVELQTAANPIIFEAMARGSMDVHPEVWLPNQQDLYDRYASVLVRNGHPARGVQGICATGDARAAGIRDVADLTDPAKTRLLDVDADGRGEIYVGAPGWSSTAIERKRAHAYGFDLTLQLVEIDEGLAESQLAVAKKRGQPWAGFCYAPHHRFVIHPDLALLTEPPHDPAAWHVPPAGSPGTVAELGMHWPDQQIQPVYSTRLAAKMPAAGTLLDNMDLNSDEISGFAYQIVVNKRDAALFAQEWVDAHAARVTSWLNPGREAGN